jgi:hypothetical protein
MVDAEFRARVLRTLRHNAVGPSGGVSRRGLKTVLCAHAGLKPMRVEEAVEELVDEGAVEYDGEKLRPVNADS